MFIKLQFYHLFRYQELKLTNHLRLVQKLVIEVVLLNTSTKYKIIEIMVNYLHIFAEEDTELLIELFHYDVEYPVFLNIIDTLVLLILVEYLNPVIKL